MEEENVGSTLPAIADLVPQQPQQDSWTSIDPRCLNGEQQAIVWDETEVQMSHSQASDQLEVSVEAGRDSPEDVEQWEQIIWPVRPMTCTSPPLSFATVQWDTPDPTPEMGELETDGCIVTELGTPLLLHQSAGVFAQEIKEEEDGFDIKLQNPSLERTGSSPEPRDAADVQEPTTQEKEESTQELLDEIPLQRCSSEEEEEGDSEASDPGETVDLNDILDEAESSEDGADSFVDLKLEEEQEEQPRVLLSGQGGLEEEQTPTQGADGEGGEEESEEEDKVGEEQEEQPQVLASGQGDPVEEQTATQAVEAEEEEEDEVEEDQEEQEEQPQVLPSGQGDSGEKQTATQGVEAEEEEEYEVAEEQEEEPQVLSSGQGDSVEEQTATQGVEAEEEEGDEVEEDQEKNNSCTEESEEAETFSCPINVEAPAEALQTDNTGPRGSPDELIDPQQSEEHQEEKPRSGSEEDIEIVEQFDEDPAGQTQQPEMCEDVDRNVDPEQTEAALDNNDFHPADDAEKSSEEIEEPTEKLEETAEEPGQLETAEEPEQIQAEAEHLEPSMESTGESTQPETTQGVSEEEEEKEESTVSEQAVCDDSKDPGEAEQPEQTEPPEHNGQTNKLEAPEQPSAETEVTPQTDGINRDGSVQEVMANGGQHKPAESESVPVLNGGEVEREMARELAERLFKLDGIQRVDVVKHLDKDHDFSRAVGEEYLKFFDFTGHTLDHALRSFLKVVVLIGETQERERVLQHFASRFHQCNPASFSSSGSVLALTCALMLLNTDLHGQNVGKSMSSSKFVSNLDGMNEGENFNKDLLKSLYNSIKSEPLEWAVDEEELKNKVLVDEDAADDAPLRSKANPFQDVPHDKTASVVKEGFLQRKLHADIDGKRTPWGKRGWKTFYGVLKGMVLYLQKDDIRRDQPTNEEVVSVHHSLAEQAAEYTKRPHVFRLQTADWRVFLFQASSRVEMNSWISRINLVSALHSSPPFPAAVGSQRRFFRPILPASQSAHTLERQLQSHAGMLDSFKADLSYLQQKPPEGKKAKAKELEEHRVRAEYLHHEMCRYEIYIQVLEAWKRTGDSALSAANLSQFDRDLCADSVGEEEEEESLKKSISSPSLETESPRPTVVKVRRNISERRTYRRAVIPRWNKEA